MKLFNTLALAAVTVNADPTEDRLITNKNNWQTKFTEVRILNFFQMQIFYCLYFSHNGGTSILLINDNKL